MTPLAIRVANEKTLPVARRKVEDKGRLGDLIGSDLHCFEVSAVSKAVHDALEAENLWPDVEAMLPHTFLPSPVTWIEYLTGLPKAPRMAWVLQDKGGVFRMSIARQSDGIFTMPLCEFRARSLLENGERIAIRSLIDEIDHSEPKVPKSALFSSVGELAEAGLTPDKKLPILEARHADKLREYQALDRMVKGLEGMREVSADEDGLFKLGIAVSVLVLDLINTPGLIGLRQHNPHKELSRKLSRQGSYPLRGWSEVVLKHQTKFARPEEHLTGPSFHKCLHFVRSHLRRYRDGTTVLVRAHWRGDPALGIKRTRYRLEGCANYRPPQRSAA